MKKKEKLQKSNVGKKNLENWSIGWSVCQWFGRPGVQFLVKSYQGLKKNGTCCHLA